jgi:hypothetical protein
VTVTEILILSNSFLLRLMHTLKLIKLLNKRLVFSYLFELKLKKQRRNRYNIYYRSLLILFYLFYLKT